MNRVLLILAALAISGVFLIAEAQPCPMCPGPQGPGMKPMRGPGFGPPNGPRRGMMRERMMHYGERATIRGRVVSIESLPRGPGGVKLMVESDSRVMPVILGPRMPLDQLSEPIEQGDQIEVKGLRMERMCTHVLVARELYFDETGETICVEPGEHDGPPMMGERQPFMGDGPPMMDHRPTPAPYHERKRAI
jgi:hypothetical protein